jgi:uncharacterized membrane protein YedE/YeeE
MSTAVAFGCGLVFALGLGIGGMTEPTRVLAFLDVAGEWDPRLALVMLGAIAVYAPVYRLVSRWRRPIVAPDFQIPIRRAIDARLVTGAIVFGIGWGLAGLCPGPALTSLASGEPAALVFVVAMLAGLGSSKLRGVTVEIAAAAAVASRPWSTGRQPANSAVEK